MGLQVSEEALRKSRCPHEFLCLTDEKYPHCRPEQPVCRVDMAAGNLLFIKDDHKSCIHKMSYGINFLCMCPVRKELYKKYGI